LKRVTLTAAHPQRERQQQKNEDEKRRGRFWLWWVEEKACAA